MIGVVGDASNNDLDHPEVRPAVFLPNTSVTSGRHALRACERRSGDCHAFCQGAAAAAQPQLGRERRAYAAVGVDNWDGAASLIAAIFALYAFVGLVLAATGLYSVVSLVSSNALGIGHPDGPGRWARLGLQLVLSSPQPCWASA